MKGLEELLDRATDRMEAPGLAPEALAIAGRRRRTRRGTLASTAAAVLVAGVLIGTRLGGSTSVDPAPAPTHVPTPTTSTAPPIAADRIQPVWDPRGAEGQPVVDLGVPRVMESLVPGPVTRPVAVLDDGERARLVSADGQVQDLDLPNGLGARGAVTISPDGTRLAVASGVGLAWRDLHGDWQRVDPDAVPDEAQLTWLPDSSGLVVHGWDGAVRVSLPSGAVERLGDLRGTMQVGVGDDGIVSVADRQVVQWRDGVAVERVASGPLEGLTLPVPGRSALAFARANITVEDGRRRADDRDGLLVVDPQTFETIAFLPVPGTYSYVHAEELRPIAWISNDELAFTVLPEGAAKEYLMTWDVRTGAISRVSCWERSAHASFATGLLR